MLPWKNAEILGPQIAGHASQLSVLPSPRPERRRVEVSTPVLFIFFGHIEL